MSKKVIWKWLGKDEFVPGVPARDLSEEEVESRGVKALVEQSVLYKRTEIEAAKKEKKDGA